ncbi:hypothetical protein J1614_008945 [Plenodomus biglobosus]|nr:hypothetical protein J1614_008945 [Plenodomus biglobosus]
MTALSEGCGSGGGGSYIRCRASSSSQCTRLDDGAGTVQQLVGSTARLRWFRFMLKEDSISEPCDSYSLCSHPSHLCESIAGDEEGPGFGGWLAVVPMVPKQHVLGSCR